MAEMSLIPADWKLPEAFRQRLGRSAGRQRLMQADGHLLLVLHEVPLPDDVTRRGVLFWRDDQGVWKSSYNPDGRAALQEHIEKYATKLEEFDQLEQEAAAAEEYSRLLEGMAPISRSVRNMLEVLQEARRAMPDDRDLIDYRDRGYDLARWAELLYDDAKNSMDVAVVRRAEEQAGASHKMLVTAHRLNVLAALFFPFATLGAIFGTTLTDNWNWSHRWEPFAAFLAGGMFFGVLLALFISRPTE